jgi:hypothetical protein
VNAVFWPVPSAGKARKRLVFASAERAAGRGMV